jgi:dihydrolipoamide dehydrogenase
MTDGLLTGVDRDLVNVLTKRLKTQMYSIMLNTRVIEMCETDNGIRVRFDGDNVQEPEQLFEKVLIAAGRVPNTSGLGLENTMVKIDKDGFIQVDIQCRTADPVIYAIGDSVGGPMLAHKAAHEGHIAAEAIAGHNAAYEPGAIPAVVFTDPEIAWCGLTETQTNREKRLVEICRFPWAASGKANIMGFHDGLTKLIIEPQTERVLGMGIVGSGAGELIAEGVLAVEMAAVVSDIQWSIHPHPTLSETIMEAAAVFSGRSAYIYSKRHK